MSYFASFQSGAYVSGPDLPSVKALIREHIEDKVVAGVEEVLVEASLEVLLWLYEISQEFQVTVKLDNSTLPSEGLARLWLDGDE